MVSGPSSCKHTGFTVCKLAVLVGYAGCASAAVAQGSLLFHIAAACCVTPKLPPRAGRPGGSCGCAPPLRGAATAAAMYGQAACAGAARAVGGRVPPQRAGPAGAVQDVREDPRAAGPLAHRDLSVARHPRQGLANSSLVCMRQPVPAAQSRCSQCACSCMHRMTVLRESICML